MDYYNELAIRKQEIENMIEEKRKLLMEAGGELVTYDQHPADLASDLYEKEKNQGILELLELELDKVQDALDKHSRGEYGVCDTCGEQIEPERLRSMINTTQCAKCVRNRQNTVH